MSLTQQEVYLLNFGLNLVVAVVQQNVGNGLQQLTLANEVILTRGEAVGGWTLAVTTQERVPFRVGPSGQWVRLFDGEVEVVRGEIQREPFGGSINLPVGILWVQHLNHGTEGNQAEPVRRLDLKFEVLVDGAILEALTGSQGYTAFWNPDNSVAMLGITSLESRAKLKECRLEFGDLVQSKITLDDVAVNKFKFTPMANRAVELSFRVQVKNPTDAELLALSKAVGQKADLHIECDLGVVMDDKAEESAQQDAFKGDDDAGSDARH